MLKFNLDETMIAQGKSLKVISKQDLPSVTSESKLTDEHVTLLVTISASGDLFEPFFIFSKKNFTKVFRNVCNHK